MKAFDFEINDRRKVFTLRELFTSKFPNLKLELYAKPHTEDGPHSDKIVKNSGLTIGDCRMVDHNGILIIDPRMTIADLTNLLTDTFGLKADVCRWTGTDWQKADSDKLTLEAFNRLNATAL